MDKTLDKGPMVKALTELALILQHYGKTFVIAVDFKDGSGDREFWSSVHGLPKEREEILSKCAGISFDMEKGKNK